MLSYLGQQSAFGVCRSLFMREKMPVIDGIGASLRQVRPRSHDPSRRFIKLENFVSDVSTRFHVANNSLLLLSNFTKI